MAEQYVQPGNPNIPVHLMGPGQSQGTGGGGRKTVILVLEPSEDMRRLTRRQLEKQDRLIHFEADEVAMNEAMFMGHIDVVVWSSRTMRREDYLTHVGAREQLMGSIRSCFGGEYEPVNPHAYLIAVVPETDYFTPEEMRKLGVREQILGPKSIEEAGSFKDRLVAAVEKAERELGRNTV